MTTRPHPLRPGGFIRLLVLSAFLAGLGGLGARAEADAPVVVHVAVDGDDRNDGLAASPGAGFSGPVASLERARSVVRDLRRSGSLAGRPVEVRLGAGTHRLDRPLVLDPEDGGDAGAPVVYRAAVAGTARLSGGVGVAGWVADPRGGLSAALEGPAFGGRCPTQLFVNGTRRERPRLPATGTFAIARAPAPAADGSFTPDHLVMAKADVPAGFDPGAGTEIVILDGWTASRMHVTGFDPATRRLDLAGDYAGRGRRRHMVAGLPYYLENQPVDRLAPGTWRCDEAALRLHYAPLAGEAADRLTAVAPRLPQLLRIAGRPDAPVSHVRIEGIAFEHTAWSLPAGGWASMQAEVGLPAAIEIENARSITLADIAVRHTGAHAVRIGRNAADIALTGSRLEDLGGGGVAIGSDQRYPRPGSDWEGGANGRAETHGILVRGNTLTGLGRIHRAAVGIWSGQARRVLIQRNHISDLFYSGISLGWVWNSGPSLSSENRVQRNVVDRYGQGLLSDFGGIYTLGRQDSTLVEDNVISNGTARDYGGHGLYADEGSHGIRFRNNTVVHTSHAAIHVHRASRLSFEDSRLFDFGEAAVRCSRSADPEPVVFRDTVAAAQGVPFRGPYCDEPQYEFVNPVAIGAD